MWREQDKMCCPGQHTEAMGAVGILPRVQRLGVQRGCYGAMASSTVDDLLTNSSRDFCNYPHILYG
jgi:hypothetical protein